MIDLFEWKIIGTTVEWRNRLYLWDLENDRWFWQVVLVVEEWSVKLFSYLYSDGYRWDSRKHCDEYFYNFEGWLDLDSLGYVKIDFDNIENVVNELVKLCNQELSFNLNWHKSDLNFFLERYEKEILPIEKVYVYYK